MTPRFGILTTPIQGLAVVQRKPLGDTRGYFERFFCQEELHDLLKGKFIVQVNHSLTTMRGTVRGLHFQHPPNAETKFVACIRGEVFDVAVDLRKGSPTFLHWYAEVLTADNHKTMVIPEGFAHGFQALTDDCDLIYLCTAAYRAEAEGALNAKDPCLSISWPLTITEQSARDASHPMLRDHFDGVTV